ncbi:MAG: hypothetical protein GC185_09320 [Alphaproteobacteria bacterium]|nr:hypothetical protein [Alphaproteobacteria bacterium]
MKFMQKTIVLTALLAVTALPLAGCSNTWQGMKNDMSAMSNGGGGHSMEVTPDNGPGTLNK